MSLWIITDSANAGFFLYMATIEAGLQTFNQDSASSSMPMEDMIISKTYIDIPSDLRKEMKISMESFSPKGVVKPIYDPDKSEHRYLTDSGVSSDVASMIVTSQEYTTSYIDEKGIEKKMKIPEGQFVYPAYRRDIFTTPLEIQRKELPIVLEPLLSAAEKALNWSQYEGFNYHGLGHAQMAAEKALMLLNTAGFKTDEPQNEYLARIVYSGLMIHDAGLIANRKGHWRSSREIARHVYNLDKDPLGKRAVLGLIGTHESTVYTKHFEKWINYVQSHENSSGGPIDEETLVMVAQAVALLEDKIDIGIRRLNAKVKSGKDFNLHEHSLMQALFRTKNYTFDEGHEDDGTHIRKAECVISFHDRLVGKTLEQYKYITTNPDATDEAFIEVPEKYKREDGLAADFDKSVDLFLRMNSERFAATALASLIVFTKNKFADEFSFVIEDPRNPNSRVVETFRRETIRDDIENFLKKYPPYDPNPVPDRYTTIHTNETILFQDQKAA